jgi:hypothetical protein
LNWLSGIRGCLRAASFLPGGKNCRAGAVPRLIERSAAYIKERYSQTLPEPRQVPGFAALS